MSTRLNIGVSISFIRGKGYSAKSCTGVIVGECFKRRGVEQSWEVRSGDKRIFLDKRNATIKPMEVHMTKHEVGTRIRFFDYNNRRSVGTIIDTNGKGKYLYYIVKMEYASGSSEEIDVPANDPSIQNVDEIIGYGSRVSFQHGSKIKTGVIVDDRPGKTAIEWVIQPDKFKNVIWIDKNDPSLTLYVDSADAPAPKANEKLKALMRGEFDPNDPEPMACDPSYMKDGPTIPQGALWIVVRKNTDGSIAEYLPHCSTNANDAMDKLTIASYDTHKTFQDDLSKKRGGLRPRFCKSPFGKSDEEKAEIERQDEEAMKFWWSSWRTYMKGQGYTALRCDVTAQKNDRVKAPSLHEHQKKGIEAAEAAMQSGETIAIEPDAGKTAGGKLIKAAKQARKLAQGQIENKSSIEQAVEDAERIVGGETMGEIIDDQLRARGRRPKVSVNTSINARFGVGTCEKCDHALRNCTCNAATESKELSTEYDPKNNPDHVPVNPPVSNPSKSFFAKLR